MRRWYRGLRLLLLVLVVLLAGFPASAAAIGPSAPAGAKPGSVLAQDAPRFFPETSFRVDDDRFFDFFVKRGGLRTFGFPVSRAFTLLGTRVQFFQRRVMQIQPDGSVDLLNVLDPDILDVNSINFTTLPPFDPALATSTPPPGSPAVLDFVRQHAPETFDGLPVGFFSHFLATVSCDAAFPGQPCDTDLLPGFDLQIWGVPTGAPARDPNNDNFVLLRFQRGIMMFDSSQGAVTEGMLLGDAFKSVITGENLPADLAQETAGSRFANQWNNERPLGLNRPADLPATDMTDAFVPQSPVEESVEVGVSTIATGLDTPWSLAFAPDGRLFITERPGRVRVMENGRLEDQPVITLPVAETGESGLMGLALDPEFPGEPFLYVMYTFSGPQGLRNRISRLRLDGNTAHEDRVLLDDLPAANIHDGGRLKFGPDLLLYATLGDAAVATRAQDPASLAGKILRLNRDGSVPAGNPFPGSYVYTLGHRNPQGLSWQPTTGRLYATEHGPSGNDEVNLIEAGQNYGWPAAQGINHPAPFQSPLVVYSPAIAPAGATFYDAPAIPQWRGNFFFTALAGAHLQRIVFDTANPRRIVVEERLLEGQFGRLRDVVPGPDGALYVATSNRDGRGSPAAADDRIVRIGP